MFTSPVFHENASQSASQLDKAARQGGPETNGGAKK